MLDDYTQSDLWGYSTIILYDYRYSNSKVLELLLDYVARGGVLIVDTYRSSDTMRGVPNTGLKSELFRYLGPLNITLWNGDEVKLNLTYEGSSWVSTTHVCINCTRIAFFGNATVIGPIKYGQGAIYVVSLNLFYYAYYTGNTSLRDLLNNLSMSRVRSAEALLEAWSDGYIRVRCKANVSFTLGIAEAWFPYWHGYMDSKPTQVYRSKEGLIALHIPPGEHVIELVFEDSFIILRYVSMAIAIIIVTLSLYSRLARDILQRIGVRRDDTR